MFSRCSWNCWCNIQLATWKHTQWQSQNKIWCIFRKFMTIHRLPPSPGWDNSIYKPLETIYIVLNHALWEEQNLRLLFFLIKKKHWTRAVIIMCRMTYLIEERSCQICNDVESLWLCFLVAAGIADVISSLQRENTHDENTRIHLWQSQNKILCIFHYTVFSKIHDNS